MSYLDVVRVLLTSLPSLGNTVEHSVRMVKSAILHIEEHSGKRLLNKYGFKQGIIEILELCRTFKQF